MFYINFAVLHDVLCATKCVCQPQPAPTQLPSYHPQRLQSEAAVLCERQLQYCGSALPGQVNIVVHTRPNTPPTSLRTGEREGHSEQVQIWLEVRIPRGKKFGADSPCSWYCAWLDLTFPTVLPSNCSRQIHRFKQKTYSGSFKYPALTWSELLLWPVKRKY